MYTKTLKCEIAFFACRGKRARAQKVRARQRRARLQSGFSPLHRRRRLRFQGAMRAPAQHLWRVLNWGKRSGRGPSKCIRTARALLIGPLRGQLAAAPHRARLQRRRDSRARIKRETARNPKRGHAKIGCLLHAQNMTPAPPPPGGGGGAFGPPTRVLEKAAQTTRRSRAWQRTQRPYKQGCRCAAGKFWKSGLSFCGFPLGKSRFRARPASPKTTFGGGAAGGRPAAGAKSLKLTYKSGLRTWGRSARLRASLCGKRSSRVPNIHAREKRDFAFQCFTVCTLKH